MAITCVTPIVAGIAAMILDCANKELPELHSLRRWDAMKGELWDTCGMRGVLTRCMTEEKRDGSYNFIKPRKLLKGTEVAIAVKISEALETKYS